MIRILHKSYVEGRIDTKKIGVKVRLPYIPEDISENIVTIKHQAGIVKRVI